MRAGFFRGKFIITADNDLEAMSMKQYDGKLVRIEFMDATKNQSGDQKAAKLYFDWVDEGD